MRSRVTLIAACSVFIGCASTSYVVHRPAAPAAAAAGSKGVGDVSAELISDGEVILTTLQVGATYAQSGEGALGDRIFRVDEYGLLEGCRWVPRGRICDLATTPDGSPLGGAMTWLVARGARATPRAGGWLAVGGVRLFHCRFAEEGPRCLPVVIEGSAGFTVLASLVLSGPGVDHDVLWIRPTQVFAVDSLSGQGEVFHRCEAAEDSDTIRCQPAQMR